MRSERFSARRCARTNGAAGSGRRGPCARRWHSDAFFERYAFSWHALDIKMTSVSAGHSVVVGLPGLEPAASSLLEIDGCALCFPAFWLVVLLRESYKDG